MPIESSPTCPFCSRVLTLYAAWEVSTLEGDVHTEARGRCEYHGEVHVTSTRSGGWKEAR